MTDFEQWVRERKFCTPGYRRQALVAAKGRTLMEAWRWSLEPPRSYLYASLRCQLLRELREQRLISDRGWGAYHGRYPNYPAIAKELEQIGFIDVPA